MDSGNIKESLLQVIRMLDKGIAMERNARNFYAAAARKSGSETGRRMFEWLAQFEIGHKARLEARREEILTHPALKGVDIPALGDYEVSETNEAIEMLDSYSDADILAIAIENEKRAYSFYQKKITYSDDLILLQMLETMAGEEDKHIKILTEQLNNIKLNQMWGEMEDLEKMLDPSGD